MGGPARAASTGRYVGEQRGDLGERFPDLVEGLPPGYWSGSRRVAQVTPTVATVSEDRRDGDTRVLRLRVISAEASGVGVNSDTTAHAVVGATVEGGMVSGAWGFDFVGMPPEGIDVVVRERGEGSVPLRVITSRSGLPQVPELIPRLHDLMWSARPSNRTFVARTYRL